MKREPGRPSRRPAQRQAGTRLVVCALVGIGVGLAVGLWGGPAVGGAAGWVAGAGLHAIWIWVAVRGLDARQTAAHAQEEDPSLVITDLVVLTAAVASLGAVGLLLAAGSNKAGAAGEALLGVAGVLASWFLVHLLYMLRYARMYYGTGPAAGGIDFSGDDPDYWDFAYIAFDLGMTYQISDTSLKNRWMRRVVLKHTLLSYALGAGVVATTINLVVSLAQGGH